jgi:hypothetical protein
MTTRTVYGKGGYRPAAADNNIIDTEQVAVSAEDASADKLRDQAGYALTANRDFLSLTSPSNAQVLAQVKSLTRQNNGLIRLLLHRFDTAD